MPRSLRQMAHLADRPLPRFLVVADNRPGLVRPLWSAQWDRVGASAPS